MGALLRWLIVDDSKADVALLLYAVRSAGYEPEYEVVDSEPAMRAALEKKEWDLITSDFRMPNFSAADAQKLASELCPSLPLIIVSGENVDNLTESLISGGAKDYVQKTELSRLASVVDRVLRDATVQHDGGRRGKEPQVL
jgi:DNA-binding NtrC family response regulator